MFACILECKVQFVPRILLHSSRHTDATRERERLQPCRDVYAIAINVIFFNDNVAHVDAHAKLNPFILKHFGIARGHTALNFDSATQRIHDTAELHQHAVAGVFNNPPAVFGDFGFDERAKMALQLDVCGLLVDAHEPAVAGDISCENGGEPSLQALATQSTPPGYRQGSLRLGLRSPRGLVHPKPLDLA